MVNCNAKQVLQINFNGGESNQNVFYEFYDENTYQMKRNTLNPIFFIRKIEFLSKP